MPRRPSAVTAVTVYQLVGEPSIDLHIRERYRESDDYHTQDVTVGDRRGVAIVGTSPDRIPAWASTLQGWIAHDSIAEISNRTAAACLLLPNRDGTRTWAMCFGLGFQLIEAEQITAGMGRSLAVRTADAERLKSLTHSRLDSRAFVARTSMPGGDSLDSYGVGGVADLVTRVVAPATLLGTTAADDAARNHEIRGADSAKIPLAKDPAALIRDLDALEDLLASEPIKGLAEIEQLTALRPQDRRVPALEDQLDQALADPDNDHVALAWPTEAADIAVPIHHLSVSGAPRGHSSDGELEVSLETIVGPVRDLPPGRRLTRLRSMRVMAFADEGDPASSLVPAHRWIVAEFHHEGQRFCLHDGRWYEIDQGLTDRITGRLERLFAVESSLPELPAWEHNYEAAYNRTLAEALGGVCLDRQLVKTQQHSKGFEACDVLAPSGVLVHVKKVDRSSPASHLFAQAAVSTEALLTDHEAREQMCCLVQAAGGDPEWLPSRPTEVALVMARRRRITATEFFSFSRVRLARLADEFDRANVRLTIHWIPLPAA